MTEPHIRQAYAHCLHLARNHYENFPVASWLLPRRLRQPVAAIYAFARRADDWADEGDFPAHERLAALDAMEQSVRASGRGEPGDDPVFIALADSIQRHALPLEPFLDLLSAFRQDVTQTRYADFGELMQYCRRSANPVGRLLLHLYRAADARNLGHADAVCSALQLTNFLQDLHQDYVENGRVYIPQDELRRFGVDEAQLGRREDSPALRQLLRFQTQRAMQILHSGAPLGKRLKGRAGFELRMIILGGNRILQYLQRQPDSFQRPRLTRRDRLHMVWGALK
ncbi:MAG TPA: squalene synthase HpnC [Gammaproteobacteria bacterium]|nr:squalene synthase HpnC [Gammaproteobacteria bacterium]